MATTAPDINIYGGINGADSEEVIGEEVRAATNFLFERRQTFNRPGLRSETTNADLASCTFARSERALNGVSVTVLIDSAGTIYRLSPTNVRSTVTGAGTSFETGGFYRSASVNGVILISSNTTGLIRHDPTTSVYTILDTNSKYRYVTSHLTRAVGAYYTDTGFAGYNKRLGWSNIGDESVWTPASNNSAGYSLINDAPDDITGVGVMRNVVVIFRRTGFHFATPTGTAQPAYNIESFSRDGIGCNYPQTLVVEDNMSWFVGEDDVYNFDLREVTPFGYKIRRELFGLLRRGVVYTGFISRYISSATITDPPALRTRYNLFPVIIPTASTAIVSSSFPHFSYDVNEDKWSRHVYDNDTLCFAFNHIQRNPDLETIGIYNGSNHLRAWDDTLACESVSNLTSGNYIIDGLDKDVRIQRMVVRHRDLDAGVATLTTSASVNRFYDSKTSNFNFGGGDGSGKWIRAFVTIELVGQDFSFVLSIPANKRFTTNHWKPVLNESNTFRGDEI